MSQTSLVGDVSELHSRQVVVPATLLVTGSSGQFHFKLAEAPEIAHYYRSHASVQIVGDLLVSLSGPVSSTVATTASVAIVPDKYSTWPETNQQVVGLEGSVRVQHSLLVGIEQKVIRPGREVASSLKPPTLIDFPPVVVGHFQVTGGNNASETLVVVHVTLSVDGVAHRCTW